MNELKALKTVVTVFILYQPISANSEVTRFDCKDNWVGLLSQFDNSYESAEIADDKRHRKWLLELDIDNENALKAEIFHVNNITSLQCIQDNGFNRLECYGGNENDFDFGSLILHFYRDNGRYTLWDLQSGSDFGSTIMYQGVCTRPF